MTCHVGVQPILVKEDHQWDWLAKGSASVDSLLLDRESAVRELEAASLLEVVSAADWPGPHTRSFFSRREPRPAIALKDVSLHVSDVVYDYILRPRCKQRTMVMVFYRSVLTRLELLIGKRLILVLLWLLWQLLSQVTTYDELL